MGDSAVSRTFCPALSLLPSETAWQLTGTLVLQAGEPISTSPSLELHLLWMWSAYQFCRALTFWVEKRNQESHMGVNTGLDFFLSSLLFCFVLFFSRHRTCCGFHSLQRWRCKRVSESSTLQEELKCTALLSCQKEGGSPRIPCPEAQGHILYLHKTLLLDWTF